MSGRPIQCKYCGISKADAEADYLADDGAYPECGATGEGHHMGPYGPLQHPADHPFTADSTDVSICGVCGWEAM